MFSMGILMSSCSSEVREQSVFSQLLEICDGLEQRLLDSSEEEIYLMADLVSFSDVI